LIGMIGTDTTFLVQLEIAELQAHTAAHNLLQQAVLTPQVELALTPQILAEFIHVVTDPRRFQKPLSMAEAIAKSRIRWNAQEVHQLFPDAASTNLALIGFINIASVANEYWIPTWRQYYGQQASVVSSPQILLTSLYLALKQFHLN